MATENLVLDKASAIKLYDTAPAFFKETLEQTFGKSTFSKDIVDRTQTIEDVFNIAGLSLDTDIPFPCPKNERQVWANYAFQLDVLNEVLNEGWEPNWRDNSEYKYYPYFDCSGGGFRFVAYLCACSRSIVGGRLVYRNAKLATHAGKKFEWLYDKVYTR